MIKYLSEVHTLEDVSSWEGREIAPTGEDEKEAFVNALLLLENETSPRLVVPTLERLYPAYWKLIQHRGCFTESAKGYIGLIEKTIPQQYRLYQQEKAIQEKQAHQQEQEERHLFTVERLNRLYPIPSRFQGEYSPINEEQAAAWRAAEQCKRGVILWGKPGTGKSHMLAGIVGKLHEKEISAAFISIADMMAGIKALFGDNMGAHKLIEKYKRLDVLAVDDIGTEKDGEWCTSQLFEIIDSRYANNLPLYGSTNLKPGQMLERYGERLFSRLCDMAIFLEIEGENIRYI